MKVTVIRVVLEDVSDEEAIEVKKRCEEAVEDVERARVEMTITQRQRR